MTPEHNRLVDKYEALKAENAALRAEVEHQTFMARDAAAARDKHFADLKAANLQNDELRLHGQRAAGQLRAILELGMYAPESFAHMRAAYESLKEFDKPKTEKSKSDCTCLFLLNGIHANGCPKCTGKPGVIPVDAEKRNDESNLCGVFVGGMGPCIAPVPCQVHPEKRPGLARICTCTGQGHTDECELAHKRFCECGHQLSVHVDGRCNGVVQAERDEPCLCEKRV